MPIVLSPTISGIWRWSLIDVLGVEHACNAEDDVTIEAGPSGMMMPPIQMHDRELPLKAGSQLQGTRVMTREFDVPILIHGLTLAGLTNRHEQLLSWLDPTRGQIKWRVTRPDDTQRELIATYVGGLEGFETPENGVETWWRGVATFRAHEPFWRDVDGITETFTLDAVAGTWFPLTFPITLAGSQVFKHVSVLNEGTAPAWPLWVIRGPGTVPVLRNLTTGKYFGLTWTLGAGETLTVNMQPLVETPVYDQGNTNRYQVRTVGSERWPLAVGLNRLQVEMAGATVDSQVTLSYWRQWLRR